MVTVTINGKLVKATDGEMLLTLLRREKIDIPALCQHDAVEPYGACRLCMVEITKPEWKGWSDYVTSCLYPVADGLIVHTHSPIVIELRKTILDLMLARNPQTPLVQKLAADYGVMKTSYQEVPEPNDCILCGLCTRICDTMGFKAISAVNRGHGKEIAPPLKQAPPDCVGCLACALNCPTKYIKFTDNGTTRVIWEKSFQLIKDAKTGQPTITREFADYLIAHRNIQADYFDINDESHRKETALNMGKIAQWQREEQS
ncbi:MAG: 2Fe-2S iron-sulfur cluster-binding protein [Candidatus Zixiibacteriota bacterium]